MNARSSSAADADLNQLRCEKLGSSQTDDRFLDSDSNRVPCYRGERLRAVPEDSSTLPPLGLTVLVVDDSATNRVLATALLRSLGCSVLVANTGGDGVRMALGGDVDVVLMDWHLPDLDGPEVTAQIRAADSPRSGVPILAVTGRSKPGEADRCIEAGMDGYLAKPLGAEQLRAALSSLAREVPGEGRVEGSEHSNDDEHPGAGPALVPDALDRLRELGGAALANHVVDLFLRDLPGRRQAIAALSTGGDAEEARLAAHALRSSALNVGAQTLSQRAGDLEELLCGERLERVLAAASALERAATSVQRELQAARGH